MIIFLPGSVKVRLNSVSDPGKRPLIVGKSRFCKNPKAHHNYQLGNKRLTSLSPFISFFLPAPIHYKSWTLQRWAPQDTPERYKKGQDLKVGVDNMEAILQKDDKKPSSSLNFSPSEHLCFAKCMYVHDVTQSMELARNNQLFGVVQEERFLNLMMRLLKSNNRL